MQEINGQEISRTVHYRAVAGRGDFPLRDGTTFAITGISPFKQAEIRKVAVSEHGNLVFFDGDRKYKQPGTDHVPVNRFHAGNIFKA